MAADASSTALRWKLADDDRGQPALDGVIDRVPGRGELRGLEFLHVRARTIVNTVPAAASLPFGFTVNAYRGCSHACSYCFARPTHEYLGLDSGRDFERRIVVKLNAVDCLRAELAARRWRGDPIAMGTNTDPYQLCEGRYRLTQGLVTALIEARNPFSILTKSTLVLRDLDLLVEAAKVVPVRVDLSIGTLDPDVWKLTEPGTPNPLRRVDAVARLNDAGVPCGILLAPVLPGISDDDAGIEAVVKAAVDAGAQSIDPVLLHLRPGVKEHYLGWLAEARPDLLARHEKAYRQAYAPAAQRHDLTGRVRRMIERHGGPAARRWLVDPDGGPPRAPASTAAHGEEVQLSLL